MTVSSNQEIVRPLSGVEELFWVLDHSNTLHFSLIGEVQGPIDADTLRKAINSVQRRHPLLTVSIDSSFNRVPHFRRTGSPIPLRIAEGLSWEEEVSRELRTPFDPAIGPLLRVVFMPGAESSIVIVTSHHAIADGMSLIFVLRDLLKAAAGQHLEPLPEPVPIDEIFGYSTRTSSAPGVDFKYSRVCEEAVYVKSTTLTVDETRSLHERARQEGTTIHGVLCGALALAARELNPAFREEDFRIFNPIDLRKAVNLQDQFQFAFIAGQIKFPPHTDASIWDMARAAPSVLAPLKSFEGGGAVINFLHQLADEDIDVERGAEIIQIYFNEQASISNVGILPYESTFGDLKLVAVWGPAVLRGMKGEQTLGAATINGALHLLHTTRVPLPELLERTKQQLTAAFAPVTLQT
ncbi:phthiocerol/phthiodiolone dimycocerosyl transferase family protein [Acidicapsa ligni]|uniref:phthiocerol/phthiodiolone dimycocerosyl transferase family protein n=1 Tax=Acidicapsa ligni TaxID=542300 RepID=UPI0021DFA301|nr:condensation domain-containing protein [Acidicapsa ligni]